MDENNINNKNNTNNKNNIKSKRGGEKMTIEKNLDQQNQSPQIIKVIKEPKVLRSNFIPSRLIYREDLIEKTNKKIVLGSGNVLIYGPPGSGKTAPIKHLSENSEGIIFVYINCSEINSFGSITREIIEQVRAVGYNEKGRTLADLSKDLRNLFNTKRKKKLVIIFDEIDRLVNKERDHQRVLATIAEATESNIIMISNDSNALRNLDPRTESRLSPEKIFIEPYSVTEMAGILKERAD